MRIYFSEQHARHDPSGFLRSGQKVPSPECPERAYRLTAALDAAGFTLSAPGACDRTAIEAVHNPEYLEFLEHGVAAWRQLPGASEEIFPNEHPSRHLGRLPDGIVGRSGWFLADSAYSSYVFPCSIVATNAVAGYRVQRDLAKRCLRSRAVTRALLSSHTTREELTMQLISGNHRN